MTFKFESPVKLPQFTKEEFLLEKQKHVAKYGYTVNVPGFRDIFTWDVTPEPSPAELQLYRQKRVSELGEKRFEDIRVLMGKKRDNYLRMLSAPTPQAVQNIASVMTALDDVNDVLGTIAVVARIVARRLPAAVAKMFLGPAGWALVGADIANLGIQLMNLPFKARRLQHALNDGVKGNPLSKRAKLRRMKKLRRLGISKGELIEAAQTTDNMFGVGLSLGPIVGLLTDIPSGIYRSIRGQKVSVKGLPEPSTWFDRSWGRLMKSAPVLFYNQFGITDREMGKAIVAVNLASKAAYNYLDGTSPLDAIEGIETVEVAAPEPMYPSTVEVMSEEKPKWKNDVGWFNEKLMWTDVSSHFDKTVEQVQWNVKQWVKRNKAGLENQVVAQNMVEVGPNILAGLEGPDQLDMSYDPVAEALLALMNVNLRFPSSLPKEKSDCWSAEIIRLGETVGSVSIATSQDVATQSCDFDFTTEVPDRPPPTKAELDWQRDHSIDGLRKWHFGTILRRYESYRSILRSGFYMTWSGFLKNVESHFLWLARYGFEGGNPVAWIAGLTKRQVEYYTPLIQIFIR
ncbi:MAG: hypothetical protein FVQ85_21685 [Planctomycetes bacterium]|nr:hypothetical protein [Planctomycetota bacterium]